MKVTVAVLCDYTNVTREGKLNILGVFNQVALPRFPAVHPAMTLVLRLELQPSELDREHALCVEMRGMDGEQIFSANSKFTAEAPINRSAAGPVDTVLRMNNLVFPKAGEYSFNVVINNVEMASVTLTAVGAAQGKPS